jgi:AraC-like DNA-binding protein
MQVPIPVLARIHASATMAVVDRPPEQHRHPHQHPHGEWNLLLSGHGHYLIDGQPWDMQPLDLLWLPPGCNHWLVRAPATLLLVIHTAIGIDGPIRLRRCDPATAIELAWLARNHPHDPRVAIRLARQLCHLGHPATPRHPTVDAAMARLQTDPAGCTLAQAAQAAGVSAGHLSGIMRQYTGRTFTWNRAMLRLLMAAGRYAPDTGWTAAASQAGFGCFMQFHRAFRAITGAAPRQWMARHLVR